MGKNNVLDHEAIRAYFRDGHTTKETAAAFGTTAEYARKICKGIRTGNQYTNGLFDREANAKRYVDERNPQFEYAGNFTGIDGFVDLKCRECGSIIRKSFVSVRHGVAECDVCRQREREWAKAEREKLRQAEYERKRAEKAREKRLNRKAVQVQMRSCLSCGSMFVSMRTNAKYCSDACRNQNKWQMKEGYRHLFPLEEVYKRDNGICYLCGKPCDWSDYEERNGVIVYGNKYPSRDHVVPKSKGGTNDWDNIRLAHRICNSLKADSPLIEKTG